MDRSVLVIIAVVAAVAAIACFAVFDDDGHREEVSLSMGDYEPMETEQPASVIDLRTRETGPYEGGDIPGHSALLLDVAGIDDISPYRDIAASQFQKGIPVITVNSGSACFGGIDAPLSFDESAFVHAAFSVDGKVFCYSGTADHYTDALRAVFEFIRSPFIRVSVASYGQFEPVMYSKVYHQSDRVGDIFVDTAHAVWRDPSITVSNPGMTPGDDFILYATMTSAYHEGRDATLGSVVYSTDAAGADGVVMLDSGHLSFDRSMRYHQFSIGGITWSANQPDSVSGDRSNTAEGRSEYVLNFSGVGNHRFTAGEEYLCFGSDDEALSLSGSQNIRFKLADGDTDYTMDIGIGRTILPYRCDRHGCRSGTSPSPAGNFT